VPTTLKLPRKKPQLTKKLPRLWEPKAALGISRNRFAAGTPIGEVQEYCLDLPNCGTFSLLP
jgi:hypothetical protein